MLQRICSASVIAACASITSGQAYHQTFEINSAATWTINGGPSDESANFFFDYSTVGIPVAPSGAGTRGMKLQANLTSGVFGGFSVSPTNLIAAGDYMLRFDWWSNVNGPFPAGGSGSANLSIFGIGTAGDAGQWPGTLDSIMFAATGDGNSTSDWRVYSPTAPNSYRVGSTVYQAAGAGNTGNTHPHYAIFGGVGAPAAQLALFPQQAGLTHIGAAGMQWHRVRIRIGNGVASWRVDGLRIAAVDLNTVDLGGGKIFFGHSDINATSSADPNDASLLFTLIDNIHLSRIADVNGDGTVNVTDLLSVIGQWGPCPAPPAVCDGDVDENGVVNVEDMLALIAAWG